MGGKKRKYGIFLHTADYTEKNGIVFIPVYWVWLL